MAWLELHQSLFTHRKTMQAAETLDLPEVYVVAHLMALWTWALDNAPDGVLPTSRRIIGKAAQWTGDPSAFVNALLDAGFLDGGEEGQTIIHDWHSYAGRLVEKREANAERMRRTRAANVTPDAKAPEIARANGVQSTCAARAGATVQNSTQHNSTEENKREEKKLPPEAPKKEPLPPRDMTKQLQLVAFCDFYAKYPVKQARQDAEKAWVKITPDETLREAIMAGLANAKGSEEWHEDGGKYIPHPATFLNRRRWEDVYTPVGARPIIPARAANGYSQPSTLQGMIDDTARAVRAEEARLTDLRQAAQRKGLPQ